MLIDNGFRLRVEPGFVPRGRETAPHPDRPPLPCPQTRPRTSPTLKGPESPPTEPHSRELRKMVTEFGLDVVQAYMGHVQDNAAEEVARLLGRLEDAEYEYPTDTGQVIKVKITVDRDRREATARFHRHVGRDGETISTAPEPVARAAVLYCFRVMRSKRRSR